jgi:pyridoxine kinase
VGLRDILVPLADAITPNLFELAWICGAECAGTAEVVAAARALPIGETVVTSAPDAPASHVRSLVVTQGAVFAADTERVAHRVHGVGDLMTSLYIGHRLMGKRPEEALRWATHGVLSVLDESKSRNADELALSASQGRLTDAKGHVIFKRIT